MANHTTAGAVPAPRFSSVLGGVLTAALMLAIPALALSSAAASGQLAGMGSQEQTAIAPADDAIANGFKILEPAPAAEPAARAVRLSDEPVEKLLQEWAFTGGPGGGRGGPSPGH
jgi:hypothetical protein